MRSARITRRQAEALFTTPPTDDDISAVQEAQAMCLERIDIDRITEDLDRELLAERRAEAARLRLDHADARRPRRIRRRPDRTMLRALPRRMDPATGAGLGGEAA